MVVLIAGSDPASDGICTALSARGADVQQLSAALAVEAIVAAVPDIVLLVGDAARQRGALIRSQLVRRLRGAEINVVVLIDGTPTLSPNASLRLLSRSLGAEAIADQLLSLAETASASRSKGTLDQVAGMITAALERPSQPPAPAEVRTPSHIVMTAARNIVPAQARQTIRSPGAIPAPSQQPGALSLAPPTSLQALAARRIEFTKVAPPPPLPEPTEVSLSDMRIETDRISGEVTIQRATVPPLPVVTKTNAPSPTDARDPTYEWSDRPTPTPSAWPIENIDSQVAKVSWLQRGSTRVGAAVALAACAGLITWSTWRSTSTVATAPDPQTEALAANSTATTPAKNAAAAPAGAHPTTRKASASDLEDTADDETGLLANAVVDDAVGDAEDPVGDEPHLLRAKQLCNEGHALRIRGRLGLAEAKYLQAIGLFPQYPRALAGVVRVHLTRGDGAEAVRWAERLIAMQPNRSNNQLLLGDAYALSGKATDARRHWRKSAAYGNMVARKRLKNDEPALAKPAR